LKHANQLARTENNTLLHGSAEPIETALFGGHGQLAAPELLDIEVLHTLRKLETTEAIPASRRARLRDEFRALLTHSAFRHTALWQDVWQLSRNLTAYDACYVALARRLEASLITRDERIARAPGVGVNVELV